MPENEVKIIISVVSNDKDLEKIQKALSGVGKAAEQSSKKTKRKLKEITPEMQELWQSADKLAKHWNVSFESALPFVKKLGAGFRESTVDTYKLATAADKVATTMNVSFKKAYSILKGMGTGFSGTSHDVDQISKRARVFSKEWGVSFKDAFQYQLKLGTGVKQTSDVVDKDTKKIGTSMEDMTKKVGKSTNDFSYHLTFIAWHFRYLGSVVGKMGQQMMKDIKDVIKVSAELQESFLSIETAAILYGESADKATDFVKELAGTGLLPLTEAANSVKNLMITGLGLPELEKFSYRYLDVAFLFTSGMDEMKKSLDVISESILRGTMILSSDVTAKTLWTETDKRLQKTMGVTLKDLSARQKAIEILKTIEDKYAATVGLHNVETETARAAINRLTTSVTLMKDAIGTALMPLLNLAARALSTISSYIQGLIEVLGPVVPAAVAAGLAVAFFVSKISFAIGIFISLQNIIRGLSAMAGVTALSLWKIYLPMIAISAVVAGGVYLFLKYSGALDKTKKSVANIDAQLKQLADTYKGVMSTQEDSIEVDEDKRIQHQRNVEDIMEDLEREKSKGLWANQITIQDLEKRLKRENEDWVRTSKGKVTTAEEGNKGILGNLEDMFSQIESDTKAHSDAIKKLWNLMGVDSWAEFKKALADPTMWSNLISEIINNIKNLIIKIGEEFWKLPPVVEGILAGIATFLLITWVPQILKTFAGLFTSIKASFLLLSTTLSTPIVISVLVAAAITAIMAVLKHFQLVKLAITDQQKAIQESSDFWYDFMEKQKQFLKEGQISAETYKKYYQMAMESQNDLRSTLISANPSADRGIPTVTEVLKGVGSAWKEIFGFQHGGIVPGRRNEAVPIMAHGGERIIPAGESVSSGAVTININNPSVRNNDDINRIARAVSQVLGRRMQLAQMSAV